MPIQTSWHFWRTLRTLGILAVWFVSIAGCSETKDHGQRPAGEQVTEEVARQKLKAALDAWTFGDYWEKGQKFEKNNLDIGRPIRTNDFYTLTSYEIGTARKKNERSFEFFVNYVFREVFGNNKGREIKTSGTATVTWSLFNDNKWEIENLGGDRIP